MGNKTLWARLCNAETFLEHEVLKLCVAPLGSVRACAYLQDRLSSSDFRLGCHVEYIIGGEG
jgi:hypothetical protein